MIYSCKTLVKVAIEPQQLVDMLDRSDPSVEVYFQENREHILAVCGEVHLERCIKDLEDTFAKVRTNVSSPIVSSRDNTGSELRP
jgi:ribosome assembly protein 1